MEGVFGASGYAAHQEIESEIVGWGRAWNDMVNEVNRRNDVFKEQHPDAMKEEIMENVSPNKLRCWARCSKLGKEIKRMGRGDEQDLSHSSNGSTSRSRPLRVDD
ncbi:hypothetical protein ACLB2K_066341 [Fragaria x ananassa]